MSSVHPADELIEAYLEGELAVPDRLRLQDHLNCCAHCNAELHRRIEFDRWLERELAATVAPWRMPARASARVVSAGRGSAWRGAWVRRLSESSRLVAGLVTVVALALALVYALRSVAPESFLGGLSLPAADDPVQSLTMSKLLIEPHELRPGELFTTTIYVHNAHTEPLPVSQLNMDINGPNHNYRFLLGSQELVPPQGVAILQITPAWLSDAGEDQYRVMAGEMIDSPGVYTISLTLFTQLATAKR